MMDRKRQPVIVGARCVFGDKRTVGIVRAVSDVPGPVRRFYKGAHRARCDDGAIENPDLRTNGCTISEWVDSAHIEMLP